MVKKSLNRFYIFGLALMATLYFFGVRPNQQIVAKHGKLVQVEKHNTLEQSAPMHQPFEIENKEEQPTSEDDDNEETHKASAAESSDSVSFSTNQLPPPDDQVISHSQTEHHAPTYVRLRTILI